MADEGDIFDYVIVGAGSAGCVLAARLSEDPKIRVLLLEAGPRDASMMLRIPAGTSRVFKPGKYNWGYFTEPEPNLMGRRIYWPRGKTLGGSSAINGMVYMRGHPDDYAMWTQRGARGWGWEDVLPYFKKAEDQGRGESESFGVGGPLAVQDLRIDDEAGRLFIESAVNAGLKFSDDFNSGDQDGVGRPQTTIRDGVRCSTAAGYLHPAKTRANLRVEVEAMANRVLMDGKRVTGVEYRQQGQIKQATATRAVISSGGAINSPQLLMLSGIGPAAHLKAMGIEVRNDLPGVGENLQDHFYVYCIVKAATARLSANKKLVGLGAVGEALKYFASKSGWLNLSANQASAFLRILPGAERPDIQVSFRPLSAKISPQGDFGIHGFPGLTAACCLLRPESMGRLLLKSADPKDYPAMQANYLDTENDRQAIIGGYKFNRKIFAADPIAGHLAEEYWPGKDVQSDDEILGFIRENAESMYHPIGTCAMGGADAVRAVVDRDCKVRGLERLYVIDASVMPTIPSGNTNAPTIMIAEKMADRLKALQR
ncbi:MAG: GMC family oxidoreductase [Sphingorhabdus sp.]